MTRDERPPLAMRLIFLGKHLDYLVEQRLAALSLNRTQTLVLIALAHHDGLKALDLCAHARVEPANVTRTLQHLERMGLAERRPHPTDGRASLFFLTPSGRAAAEKADEELHRLSDQILAGVGEDDLASLRLGLRAVWTRVRVQLAESGHQRPADGEPDEAAIQVGPLASRANFPTKSFDAERS